MMTLDQSRWPLLITTSMGSASQEMIDEYQRGYDRLLARGERHVTIIDLSRARPPELRHVKQQAAWNKANAARLGALCLGAAFVAPAPMIRGAIKAVLWMAPLPFPHTVVATFDEALQWVEQKAKLGNIVLPASRKVS